MGSTSAPAPAARPTPPSWCAASNASCDNRATLIASNTIHGCNLDNWQPVGTAAALSNHDAIYLMSVPGLVFNNELYDWAKNLNSELKCDSLIDVANRRPCDRSWTGHHTRLERNILSSGLAKTEGPGETENSVTWANGIFSGVHFQDYHGKWHDHYLHRCEPSTSAPSLRAPWFRYLPSSPCTRSNWQYPFDSWAARRRSRSAARSSRGTSGRRRCPGRKRRWRRWWRSSRHIRPPPLEAEAAVAQVVAVAPSQCERVTARGRIALSSERDG